MSELTGAEQHSLGRSPPGSQMTKNHWRSPAQEQANVAVCHHRRFVAQQIAKGVGGNPGLYGVLARVKSSLGSRRSVTGATCQSRQLAVESPARRTRPLAAPRAGQVWTLWRGRFVPQDARTQWNVPSLLLLLQPRPAQSRWRASSLPGAQHPRRRTRHHRLRTSPRHVVASRCSPERRARRVGASRTHRRPRLRATTEAIAAGCRACLRTRLPG